VAVAGSGIWLFRIVAAIAMLLVPGQFLLQALRIPASAVRRCVTYLPAASVAVLVIAGLAVDLLGPALGLHAPLHRWPLLTGLNVTLVVLGVVGATSGNDHRLKPSDLVEQARWLWPMLVPVLALVAADRLNAGKGNALAIGVLVALVVIVPVFALLADRTYTQHLRVVIYGAGLAAMLLTSMRSSYVVGYDISSEYYDFHQIVTSGIWHFGHLAPYQAMMSVTVLPAGMHALISGQDVWIFKLIYPALFAFFPVAVFDLARRFLSRRAAFIAAGIVIVQSYFFQQQPEIARQELALVVFAALVCACLDSSLRRRRHLVLVGVLAATLVVCHYSTTYVAIALFLVGAVLVWLTSRRRPSTIRARPLFLALAVMVVVAFVWYVPLTNSTSNITYAVQSFTKNGVVLLPGRQKGESIIGAYFNGVRRQPASPATYQREVAALYSKSEPFLRPLLAARQPRYDLRSSEPAELPTRIPGLAAPVGTFQLLIQQLINALGVVGCAVLALRRRAGMLPRAVGFLGLAALAVLAASRLSGTLAADYNSSRLFLQCLFVVAVADAALFEVVTKTALLRRARPLLLCSFGAALGLSFAISSGLADAVDGGGPAFVLYNKGEDFDRLYTTPSEQATATWLAANAPANRVVYADNYASLQLREFTGMERAVFTAVTPLTIDQHAWVYASRTNIVLGRTWGGTSSGELDLAFPTAFLNRYFDAVYSTGTTAVYHR
ncbi:MAG: hypothetical protein WCF24_09330, partial [Acidimicrobiales bacterium]